MAGPDRSNAFLMNPGHRPFATGAGPLPSRADNGVVRGLSMIAKITLAVGGGFVIAGLNNARYLYISLVFFSLATVFFVMNYRFRKTRQKWAELGARGIRVDAELTKASIRADEGGKYLICRYRFTSPRGTVLTGHSLTRCPEGIDKNNLPDAGAPMVVVYVDDEVFEVL